jgi:hypothetical protein
MQQKHISSKYQAFVVLFGFLWLVAGTSGWRQLQL